MAPHEVRTAHDYWYPVRDIRGFQNASPDFAVQTDLRDGKAFAGVHATSVFESLTVVLRDARDGSVLRDKARSPRPPAARGGQRPRCDRHRPAARRPRRRGPVLIELQRVRQSNSEPQKEWGEPSAMTPDGLFTAVSFLPTRAGGGTAEGAGAIPATRVGVSWASRETFQDASAFTGPHSVDAELGSTSVIPRSGRLSAPTTWEIAARRIGDRLAARLGWHGWSSGVAGTRRPSTGCARQNP
jgi:hypothetical protein